MEIELSQIKKLRKQLGLTQEELAKAAGVSQSLIAKVETGNIDPAFTKVKKITRALSNAEENGSLKAKDIMSTKIIYVSPNDTLETAVKKMNDNGISQIVVLKGKNCSGLVTEAGLLSIKQKKEQPLKVSEAMQQCPPIVQSDTPLSGLSSLIEYSPLIIVAEGGVLKGVITKTDLIRGLYSQVKKRQ